MVMGSGSSNQILDSSTGDTEFQKNSETKTKSKLSPFTHSTKVLQNEINKGFLMEDKTNCDSYEEINESLMHVKNNTSLGNPRESMKIEANPTSFQQVDDSLGQKICELQNKIKQREHELAKVESEKLDLQDQVQTLEEKLKKCESLKLPSIDEEPILKNETLLAKDQYISKLESDLQKTVQESNTIQMKLKKKIRMLRNQVRELRQEASIKNLEMKLEMTDKYDQLKESKDMLDHKHGCDSTSNSSSHSKVIVELSNQLTEQSEHIAFLESKLAEKDLTIQKLEKAVSKKSLNSNGNSTDAQTSTRVDSKAGDSHSNIYSPKGKDFKPLSNVNQHSSNRNRPVYERQAIALSDSDSDWGLDNVMEKHLHFSPESRVQSAVTVSHYVNGNEEQQPKPASAGSSFDQRKHRKKTALQRRVNDKLKSPQSAFTANNEESKNYLNTDVQNFKGTSLLPELSQVKSIKPMSF